MDAMTTVDPSANYEKSPVPINSQDEATDSRGDANQTELTDNIGSVSGRSMSSTEIDRLAELETVVDQGHRAFIAVGSALVEIRESRLYRQHHTAFAEYVRERFSFEKSQAYRLCSAAAVVESVPNWGQSLSESQLRELGKIAPERRSELLQRATDLAEGRGQSLTAATIAEARELIVQADPFTDALESMRPGDKLVQFAGTDDDSTIIARLDDGYLVVREIIGELTGDTVSTPRGVTLALQLSDPDYDTASGLEPFRLMAA